MTETIFGKTCSFDFLVGSMSTNMEEVRFMTYIAASHQGVIKMIWFYFIYSLCSAGRLNAMTTVLFTNDKCKGLWSEALRRISLFTHMEEHH